MNISEKYCFELRSSKIQRGTVLNFENNALFRKKISLRTQSNNSPKQLNFNFVLGMQDEENPTWSTRCLHPMLE